MPRSASRDRSDRFDGRRGYFRRLDAVGRAKLLLSAVAAAGVVAWAAADTAFPKETQAAHTHGELADPHAALHDNCQACHAGFTGGKNAGLFEASHRWREWKCAECHKSIGPLHAKNTPADTDCGSCHRDHKGGLNRLTRVADSHCTGCHSETIKGHPNPSGTPVTAFAKDHPPFKPLATPPAARTMKFSHALHMTPGLPYTPGGKEELTPARTKQLFGQPAVDRYFKPDAGPTTLLQLNCADCHTPDAGGKHFQPVSYEQNCRLCHKLEAPAGASDKLVVKEFLVPHKLTWEGIREAVTAGYLRELVRENRDPLAPAATPGDPALLRKAEEAAFRVAAADLTAKAMAADRLGGRERGCVKCHDLTGSTEVVKPAARKEPWLVKATFNHAPHQRQACADCHDGTGKALPAEGLSPLADVKETVKDNIADLASCQRCHTPRTVSKPNVENTTGVRHGCTDCHGYHHK